MVLEAVGICFVIAEVVIIRIQEFGVPPSWARLAKKIRKRARTLSAPFPTEHVIVRDSVTAKLRPSDPAADATDRQRIDRLERYVKHIDNDLATIRALLGERTDEVLGAVIGGDERVRDEIARADAERRAKLRCSLGRQATGAVLVFVGLMLQVCGICSG